MLYSVILVVFVIKNLLLQQLNYTKRYSINVSTNWFFICMSANNDFKICFFSPSSFSELDCAFSLEIDL